MVNSIFWVGLLACSACAAFIIWKEIIPQFLQKHSLYYPVDPNTFIDDKITRLSGRVIGKILRSGRNKKKLKIRSDDGGVTTMEYHDHQLMPTFDIGRKVKTWNVIWNSDHEMYKRQNENELALHRALQHQTIYRDREIDESDDRIIKIEKGRHKPDQQPEGDKK